MLTDKDKVDLICYISNIMKIAQSDCARDKLVALSHGGILRFIISHPDVCAAELDEFFLISEESFIQEYNRLKRKGVL